MTASRPPQIRPEPSRRRPHRAARWSPGVLVGLLVAALAALLAPGAARADLPGSIRLSAASGGNLWWIAYRRANSAIPGGQQDRARGEQLEFLLMHHAVVEPAPTERLVIRFEHEPVALAAEGDEIVVVSRRTDGAYPVLSMRAVQNPAVGHWYTEPRDGPRVLPALRTAGEVRATALAGGRLHALVREPRTAESPESLRLFELVGASAGTDAWRELPLPAFDPAEPIRLAGVEGRLCATGFREGASGLAELRDGAWHERAFEAPAGLISPRGLVGLIAFDGRTALVTRTAAGEPSSVGSVETPATGSVETPTRGSGESPPAAEMSTRPGTGARIQLSILRQSSVVPWASFPEPSAPWSLAGFGADAALLTLDPAARGVVQTISTASSEPGAAIALAPPGFAARRWVHLPILGILSIALVLAALIFGTGGYADRQAATVRDRQAVEDARAELAANPDGVDRSIDLPSPLASRPRGAGLAERGAAFAIDLLPGVLVAWALEGGNPLDLVQIPLFVTDVERALPAFIALAIGWTLASGGDILFGRSLGKRVLGLRIVGSASAAQAAVGARVVRALLSLIAVASPVVMLIATLHPYGDGPAEMLSRTAVVPEAELATRGAAAGDDAEPGA